MDAVKFGHSLLCFNISYYTLVIDITVLSLNESCHEFFAILPSIHNLIHPFIEFGLDLMILWLKEL